jgi:sugar (pentulose or hexulose) kinase
MLSTMNIFNAPRRYVHKSKEATAAGVAVQGMEVDGQEGEDNAAAAARARARAAIEADRARIAAVAEKKRASAAAATQVRLALIC